MRTASLCRFINMSNQFCVCLFSSPVFPGLFDFCSIYTGASLEGAVRLNQGVSRTCTALQFVFVTCAQPVVYRTQAVQINEPDPFHRFYKRNSVYCISIHSFKQSISLSAWILSFYLLVVSDFLGNQGVYRFDIVGKL